MKYLHIISKLKGAQWCITEQALQSIVTVLNSRINGIATDSEQQAEKAKPTSLYQIIDGAAVIPVSGVIGKRLSMMESMCGGVDVDAVRTAFDAANLDASASSIVLHVDSPGGTVTGVSELANYIRDNKSKPTIAYTDTLAASAGYWLSAATDAIVASESALVGSIGVISHVVDASREVSNAGLVVRTYKSGQHKDIGSQYRAPTEEEEAFLQESVDATGAEFRGFVKSQRPNVPDSSMTGLYWNGKKAKENGLVDYIANTLQDAIKLINA